MIKKLFLFLFSLSTTIVSVHVAFYVTEKYFFDKLFYKKSPIYGYTQNELRATKYDNNPWIEKRIRDIRLLVRSKENGQVLGVKTGDEYTIALIGDSMTYGLGVRENESFGRVLEERLDKIRPTRIYVLSLPGDSIVENYSKFLMARSLGGVNLYVIEMLQNDLLYDHNDKYPNEQEAYKFLRTSCPGEEFTPDQATVSWEQKIVDEIVPSYSRQFTNRCYAETAIRDMIEKSDQILFYFLDHVSDGKLSFVDKAQNEVLYNLKNIVNNASGVFIDTENIINWDYREVSNRESHPSARTHRDYAETLYKEITANSRWRFVSGQPD